MPSNEVKGLIKSVKIRLIRVNPCAILVFAALSISTLNPEEPKLFADLHGPVGILEVPSGTSQPFI